MDHWHILGAGAIGCLFAHYLRETGSEVTLLLRDDDPATAAGTVDIHVEGVRGASHCSTAASGTTDSDEIDLLLVCTKSYAAAEALAAVQPRLAPNAAVVLLMNGLGVRETLLQQYPALNIFQASTTEGAYTTAPRRITHAGLGSTYIGQPGLAEPPPWFDRWRASALNCYWEPDIETALWRKLAINCAINPLTAIHRCRNGELAQRPALRQQVDAVCGELAAVSRALGYTEIAESIAADVYQVIEGTANNRSSMHQDAVAGRRTEADFICGYFEQRAREAGIATPVSDTLYSEVLAIGSAGSKRK